MMCRALLVQKVLDPQIAQKIFLPETLLSSQNFSGKKFFRGNFPHWCGWGVFFLVCGYGYVVWLYGG